MAFSVEVLQSTIKKYRFLSKNVVKVHWILLLIRVNQFSFFSFVHVKNLFHDEMIPLTKHSHANVLSLTKWYYLGCKSPNKLPRVYHVSISSSE